MEDGLTADAVCVYEWTEARNGTTPVCLWGHSLGTGVATNAAKVLEEKGFPVDAVILEAPFTNIWVASINYPLLKPYECQPHLSLFYEKKVSREFKEVAEWFYTASQC
ncbi:protein ABHD12B isoform X4 [Physeter macrocephalus]|uniref:Protein ABHD12B isoform X4 n=1 Tax=Physeter macrocephalus TaxID=9755 RepID=A0A9W2WZ38_PHYMC|nr:protein ABHD12B isoform X4 [Physeter catodon]